MRIGGKKRGQVTLFIIIGVVIVLAVSLLYFFYPRLITTISFGEETPAQFMQNCIGDELADYLGIVSLQGGSMNPENYIMYKNEKVEYLCYTEEAYRTCIVQRPMIKRHIEEELENAIQRTATKCLEDMKTNYEQKGYSVAMKNNNFSIELLPKKVLVSFNTGLSLTKEDTQVYDSVKVVIDNNLYELTSIAQSILSWETNYGDAETTTYMDFYPNIKVEKYKQSDGSTIYIITERDSGDKFQFASRSMIWPAGGNA